MQENRSFDNLFMGFPGADTVSSGYKKGARAVVPLQPIPLEQGTDLDHSHHGWWADWDNGAMDGFHTPSNTIPNLEYGYVPQYETVPYWTLARRYTLADRMFQSNTGPSFVAHQYMIAGQSADADENPELNPWGCDSGADNRVALIGPNGTDLPGVYPCFDYRTIADLLDTKGITWRYYAPGSTEVSSYQWSAYQAIRHIRFGPDWSTDVISPNTRVLTDIAKGELAQVTWIVPAETYSDHANSDATAEGPDWVASITNAIGASQFWDSTVIFISWDDWGGWYDHVAPPQIDNMGLGFRVPLIIVSPYAKTGYISHTTHEFSGFLKYTEEVFGLPSLGTRDVNTDDFSDCFDYTQLPQPYVQIPVTFGPNFFVNDKDSLPPDND
jgi:phospholipase C